MKDLSLHIMDIVQNSITAGSDTITVSLDKNSEELLLQIQDNGKGMSKETIKRVTDPYYTSRTTRKVGLGIPLLKQNAERTNGTFNIQSEINVGTTTSAKFIHTNIDMLPLGDIGGVISLCMSSNPDINFIFKFKTNDDIFEISTNDIKEVLEDVPISDPQVISYIKNIINENIN
ncbi:MAG: sensor histidine kinase [Bacteroidales bacterium]|jgi:signal transduction histidine kinase